MYKHPTSIAPFLASLPAAAPVENALLKTNANIGASNRNKLQNVPAFLNKLYSMVDDSTTDDLIKWSDDGASFIVTRHEDFAKIVLPRFFKHSNFSSFVRQLNMYGFHKIPHMQQGVLQADDESERWEFSNPHFQRNQPDLLLLVTRKKGRDVDEKEPGNIDLQHILDEISAIKKHQSSISADLVNVQNNNQLLWQETLQSRDRYQRHQETIDKILRFLASVFSGDKNRVVIPQKRRFLIEDGSTEYDADGDENDVLAKKQKISPKLDIMQEFLKTDDDEDGDDPVFPPILSDTKITNPPTSELAEAIALNNETKEHTAKNTLTLPSDTQDFSTLLNTSHLPDLQNIIAHNQNNTPFDLTNTTNYGIKTDYSDETPSLSASASLSTSPNSASSSAALDSISVPQNLFNPDVLSNFFGNSSDLNLAGIEALLSNYIHSAPPSPYSVENPPTPKTPQPSKDSVQK